MITQGSKAHPVKLNDHLWGPRIKEVHWELGLNIVTVDYPSDCDYNFFIGKDDGKFADLPKTGRYKVGDKVDKTLVTDNKELSLFFVDFDENQPVGGEIGGNWKTGFLYDTPRLWGIPTIPIVDGIDPNPFHDEDQGHMDIWHAWWVKAAQEMYDNGNVGLPQVIADFKKKYAKTQILTVSSFSEFEPTPKGGWGTKDYFYNNVDTLEYVSQVFSFLRGGELIKQTLDLSLVWNYFETNLSTGTGGFRFTINLKPQQGTLVVGQFWVPIEVNKDVWIVNGRQLKDTVEMKLFSPTKAPDDVAKATVTYMSGVAGGYTVDKGRVLKTGKAAKTVTRTVSMKGHAGDVLLKFDSTGFVT